MKKTLIIFIIGLIIGGGGLYGFQHYQNQKGELSPAAAADKAIEFINTHIEEGVTASLINVSEESGVYKINLQIADQEYESYVTRDGKILFSSGIHLKKEISKRDTPDVKLFVMSYCPYGLQAQKAFLPVYNLLKDRADMGVYFVDYIMHGKKEIDENLRQYCIQKRQKDKYDEYLSCFVRAGDYNSCLNKVGIDEAAMDSCIAATDEEYKITEQYNDQSTWLWGQYPKFDVHADLNKKYGIRGSPTLVINDRVVSLSSRSPEKFKEVLCQAFSSPPEECSQTLSDKTFSPGFGLEEGTSSRGSCQ